MYKIFTIFLLIFLLSATTYAQRIVLYPDRVDINFYHDTTEPLSERNLIPPQDAKKMYPGGIVPNFEKRSRIKTEYLGPQESDPVVQTRMGTKQPVLPTIQNFEGMNRLNAGGATPPDCSGDIGPEHYVQMVNLAFQVFNKSGQSLYGPASNRTIFDGWDDGQPWDNTNDGDPILLYDDQADRWVFSHFSLPTWGAPYYMLVAYSATSDPLGPYHRYAFTFNNFPDYPKLGIWQDGLYITVNSNTGQAAVFERDSMLVGAPARMVQFTIPDYPGNGFRAALAADCDGPLPPPGTPNYLVYFNDNAWNSFSTDHLRIWEFSVDWNNTSNSTLSMVNTLVTESFDSNFTPNWNDIPQPNSSQKLDAIAGAVMYRLQYRRFSHHETMLCNYVVDMNGANRAGIRWYELRKDVDDWYIYQQGTYAPDETNRWNASMSMDKHGNIAIAYSVSSSTVYPGLRYTGRTVDAPLGEMNIAETEIFAGSGTQSGTNRYGDYAQMGVDPTDDETFWFTSEYIPSNGHWRTRIASFKFDSFISADIDAAVLALNSPVTGGIFSEEEPIVVNLFNYGVNPIDTLAINLWIDGVLISEDTITSGIAPMSHYNYTFQQAADLSAYTVYELKIIASLSGDTITQNDTLVVILDHPEPAYCDAEGAEGGEFITQVELNTFTGTSGASAYSDFTGDTIAIKQGGVYSFNVLTSNEVATNQVIAWFDWDGDKVFNNTNEKLILSASIGLPVANHYMGSVNVPMGAPLGTTRMRIRLHDVQNGANYTSCDGSTYGEVEDYTLQIVDPLIDQIIEPRAIRLEIYPNPATDRILLSMDALAFESYLQIIDANGKEQYRKYVAAGSEIRNISIMLDNYSPGMYFVRLRLPNENILKVEKFIKQ